MSAPRPSIFTKLFRRSPATAPNSRPDRRTRLHLSALDERIVMAASLTATLDLADHVLRVEGTDGPDDIQVYQTEDGRVAVNGVTVAVTDLDGVTTDEADVPEGDVTRFEVNAYGGDDTITVGSWSAAAPIPMVLTAGDGDDTVYGGAGGDTIECGAGNDTVYCGAGNNTVSGGDGDDVIAGGSGGDLLTGGAGANSFPGADRLDVVVDDALTGGRAMNGAVFAKYIELGGPAGPLGQPTADAAPFRAAFQNGLVTAFENGKIYSSEAAGVYALTGAIQAKYTPAVAEALGFPTSDEAAVPGGVAVEFQYGTVTSGATAGTHFVYGPVRAKYVALGGPAGDLGLPTSDVSVASGRQWTTFERGAVYSNSATGAHVVTGDILKKYVALGGPAGWLGLPTTDVASVAGTGAWAGTFQNGGIYWGSTTGAHAVNGDILKKYLAMGGPAGTLGLPTGDIGPAGGAWLCPFQNGTLYWTPPTGAHAVLGAIRAEFDATAFETDATGKNVRALIGYPTTDEMTAPDGVGKYTHFQAGSIYWSPSTGAHVVYGAIRNKWASLGWERGLLGYPKSDEHIDANGFRAVNFQNGTIVWRADAGVHLSFNRAEMVGAIRATERDGVLDKGEFDFLHGVEVDLLTYMPDSVRNLTRKLIDGDRANATTWDTDGETGVRHDLLRWVGNPVGNLAAGSPAWKVEKLVRKWFEGADRPANTSIDGKWVYFEAAVQGDLFRPGGPNERDIDQGGVGDCYFIAALEAVGLKHPNLIRDMFTDNGDGTFTVRFFHDGGGPADYVTVDRRVPIDFDGRLVYEGAGRAAALKDGQSPADFPVWAILAEKAYAQLNQSGWIGQDGTNSYNGIPASAKGGINSGKGSDALAHITGWVTHTDTQGFLPWSAGNFRDAARNAVSSGRTVVVGTGDKVSAPELAPHHAYVLFKADAGGFLVLNPWGHDNLGGIYCTYITNSQFSDSFTRSDSID